MHLSPQLSLSFPVVLLFPSHIELPRLPHEAHFLLCWYCRLQYPSPPLCYFSLHSPSHPFLSELRTLHPHSICIAPLLAASISEADLYVLLVFSVLQTPLSDNVLNCRPPQHFALFPPRSPYFSLSTISTSTLQFLTADQPAFSRFFRPFSSLTYIELGSSGHPPFGVLANILELFCIWRTRVHSLHLIFYTSGIKFQSWLSFFSDYSAPVGCYESIAKGTFVPYWVPYWFYLRLDDSSCGCVPFAYQICCARHRHWNHHDLRMDTSSVSVFSVSAVESVIVKLS